MGVTWLVVQLGFIFVLTVLLLNKYGSWRKQHTIVSASTLIGWYFSFLIILVLPLDVAITFYEKCLLDETRLNTNNNTTLATIEIGNVFPGNITLTKSALNCEEPKGYVSVGVLLELWRVVYWTTQILTWIILPLLQSYSRAGKFTTIGRLRSAVYNNAIYYTSYGVTFFFLLIYAISKGVSLNFEHLKVLIVSASNTWGLFLLVLLLGYGLVEVPRHLWQMGSRGYRLKKTYFDIDTLSIDKNDAEETIDELYREAREVFNVLKSTRGDAREKAQQIVSKFPADVARRVNSDAPRFGNASNVTDADTATIASDVYLIRLHKRVIDAVQNHHRCQAQWAALLSLALYLEDVEVAETTRQLPARWTSAALRPGGGKLTERSLTLLNALEHRIQLPHLLRFHWHVNMQRPLFQTLGALCAAMTVLIAWSECTFFIVSPQLSLAARLLHMAAAGYHYKYIQICGVLLLFYLGVCAYFTVFRLRIYRYYHLDPNKMTDENSLIFSTMLLCRLTPPMCLNFLGMIHMDSHITSGAKFAVETQFTRLMGHLDVIPLVAKGINIYLPILILLLCFGTWFKLGTRMLHSLGIDQFISENHFTAEMIANGKALVTLERNKINRERGRDERNRAWSHMKQQQRVKSKNHFERVDYSEREPIMPHQNNDGLLITDDAIDDTISSANSTVLFETPARVAVPPSIADLEFGCAFDQPQVVPVPSTASNNDTKHATPMSIFDDL